jgi:hypothetical protein
MTYPDVDAKTRLARLIGIDAHKARLSKMLGLLVNPTRLQAWVQKHHPEGQHLLSMVLHRPPLVVLAGDVGSGKSELAECIGDEVARQEPEQRRSVLHDALSPFGFSHADIEAMVAATGPKDGRSYGFAFSDIVQRLLPAVVLDAYPDAPVAPARAIQIACSLVPTPPFREET